MKLSKEICMRDSDRCVGEGMWGMVIRDVARDKELSKGIKGKKYY